MKAPGTSKDARAITPPSWRAESRRLIQETIDVAIEDQPELEHDPVKLFELVAKAYPYGPRKHREYRIWMDELRLARSAFDQQDYEPPLDRACGTCGARRGQPCKPANDEDPIAHDLIEVGDVASRAPVRRSVALSLAAAVVHATRREPIGGTR